MGLNLKQKQAEVASLSDMFSQTISVVMADYSGLNVSQMTTLRSQAREKDVAVRVARNTLITRAVEGTPFDGLKDELKGPVVLFCSRSEPGAAARILREFLKKNEQLEVKAIVMDGIVMPATQLDAVAKLPTRDEGIAILMRTMLAPVTQFVRTVREPVAQGVRAFAAVRDLKESQN